MNPRQFGVAGLLLCLSTIGWANTSNDKQLQWILTDIQKYEQQLQSTTRPSPAHAKRALRLLALRRQSLDALPKPRSAQWTRVNARLEALMDAFQAIASGKPEASVSMPSVERTKQPPATKSSNSSLTSYHRTRLKKLQRDIRSSLEALDQGGLAPLQDPNYVERHEQRLRHYRQALEAYQAHAADPDVKATQALLDKFSNMLAWGKQQAAKQSTQLGDVQARLRHIDQQMRALTLPALPQPPFQPNELKTWLQTTASVRQQAKQALAELEQIATQAHLPHTVATVEQGGAYDRNDVQRMQRHLSRIEQQAVQNITKLEADLQANLEQGRKTLVEFAKYDPLDTAKRSHWFLGKGRAQAQIERLQRIARLARDAAEWSRLLGHDTRHRQRLELFEQAQAAQREYREKHRIALAKVRMPSEAKADEHLLEIAQKTLANPKYGVGQIERMTMTAPRRRLEKKTTEMQYDGVRGTRVTYHYVWDEFQVATAEREGERYFIYYNTLKYFTRGDSTTPLNRWVLSERFAGSEIPKENIHLP